MMAETPAARRRRSRSKAKTRKQAVGARLAVFRKSVDSSGKSLAPFYDREVVRSWPRTVRPTNLVDDPVTLMMLWARLSAPDDWHKRVMAAGHFEPDGRSDVEHGLRATER